MAENNVIDLMPHLRERQRKETEEWMKTNGVYPMSTIPNWLGGLFDTEDKPSDTE